MICIEWQLQVKRKTKTWWGKETEEWHTCMTTTEVTPEWMFDTLRELKPEDAPNYRIITETRAY